MVLLALFPLFAVLITECNQAQHLGDFIDFVVQRPGILVFDVLLVSLFFWGFTLLVRRGWISVFLTAGTLYAFSCVEFFKCSTSGTHFLLSDLVMTANASDIAKFAYIKITWPLALCLLAVLLYFGAVFWLNPKIGGCWYVSVGVGAVMLGLFVGFFFMSGVNTAILRTFGVDVETSYNTFKTNEKFAHNQMIANVVENAVSKAPGKKERAGDYETYDVQPQDVSSYKQSAGDFVRPNVIMIMNESFADFRIFEQLGISDEVYQNFDRIGSEGYKGTTVVPTFGGFTVKTEFELNFGLPMRGLKDEPTPQKLLKDREQDTFAYFYKDLGYETSYIHPFSATFYGRNQTYSRFGYDNLMFEGDFTVPTYDYNAYIDDDVVYTQIERMLREQDKPAYIYTTTMQNHQPYKFPETGMTELEYYLSEVQHSDQALGRFIESIKKLDEPTIVFFVGDHFPFFSAEDDLYESLGISSENCAKLYQQSYLVWANYDADLNVIPQKPISAFYIPYVLADVIHAPLDPVRSAVLGLMQTTPVYSYNASQPVPENQYLNMLTYDIVEGDQRLTATPRHRETEQKEKTQQETDDDDS